VYFPVVILRGKSRRSVYRNGMGRDSGCTVIRFSADA